MSPVDTIRDLFPANDAPGDLRAAVARNSKVMGGGSGDGMEPRVAKLEASVAHIERDIADIKLDSRELRADMREVRERQVRLEEKVAHLPSKGFIVASLLLSLAVVAGLLAFQGQIQKFTGSTPVTVTAP